MKVDYAPNQYSKLFRKVQPSVAIPSIAGGIALFLFLFPTQTAECPACELCQIQPPTIPVPTSAAVEELVSQRQEEKSIEQPAELAGSGELGVGALLSTILGSEIGGTFMSYATVGFTLVLILLATTITGPLMFVGGFIVMNFVPVIILSVPVGFVVGTSLIAYRLFGSFDIPGMSYIKTIVEESADRINELASSGSWAYWSLLEFVSQVVDCEPLRWLLAAGSEIESWLFAIQGIIQSVWASWESLVGYTTHLEQSLVQAILG